jgi:polar amino acid transport system permease protein
MGIRALIVMLVVSVLIIAILASQESYRIFVPGLLEGALLTVKVTVLAALLAVVMGVLAALGKLYGPAPIRWLANIYIEIFRGTSALVQLFWLFFVLPSFNIELDPFTVAVLALGLNIGAYGAECARGAITSVARGQWEAATALNMTRFQMLRRIILPQAFIAMIPPWGNLFIELLKSTSLVALITLADLTFKAQQMNQTTMKTVQIFNLVLLIYLAMSLVITIAMRLAEQRASRGLARGRTV